MCYEFICQVNKSEREGQMQVAHVAIAIEKGKNRAYKGAIMKRGGVVLSNQSYCTHSPRGEYRAGETRDMWRQLEV